MADKKTPKPDTALAYAASVLEENGIAWTLNPSMETTVTFIGPIGAAALVAQASKDGSQDGE